MNGLVKSIRHIQLKKISVLPELYTALITYETHPNSCEYDEYNESDDIENQKNLINKLIQNNWFISCKNGEINTPDPPNTPNH